MFDSLTEQTEAQELALSTESQWAPINSRPEAPHMTRTLADIGGPRSGRHLGSGLAQAGRRAGAALAVILLLGGTGRGKAEEKDPILADFERFDRDKSGYLSKAEMAACACASFDANGDQILMPAEYAQGRRAATVTPSPQPPPAAPLKRTKAEFDRFDADASGYLSRAEARACGCESLDANGDQIIMPAEFIAETRRPDAGPAASPPAGRAATRPSGASVSVAAGDRVQAGCYGNMKTGVVDRVEGDRAWVRFADEPNCDGYRELASLKPAAPPRGVSGDPAGSGGAPPSGTYVCQKISGSSLMGLGNLEIRGTTYSGIGGGGFAPFTVSGTGELGWTRGIRGLPDGWTVTSSRFAGLDYLGRPLIKIGYRTSRGSSDLIDCVRE